MVAGRARRPADIWRYYATKAGPDTAEKMVRELYGAAQLLAEHPFGGCDRDEIRAGLRSLSIPPHVLFYRINDEAPEIIRMLDARQDIQAEFQ